MTEVRHEITVDTDYAGMHESHVEEAKKKFVERVAEDGQTVTPDSVSVEKSTFISGQRATFVLVGHVEDTKSVDKEAKVEAKTGAKEDKTEPELEVPKATKATGSAKHLPMPGAV